MHTQASESSFKIQMYLFHPNVARNPIRSYFLPFQTRLRYAVRENPDPIATHSTPPPLTSSQLARPPEGGRTFIEPTIASSVKSLVEQGW